MNWRLRSEWMQSNSPAQLSERRQHFTNRRADAPDRAFRMSEKAAEAMVGDGSSASAPDKRRGKGLALMSKVPAMPGNAGSSAWIELAEDGTLTLGVGCQDIGQGAFTVAAQMAAAAFGIPTKRPGGHPGRQPL